MSNGNKTEQTPLNARVEKFKADFIQAYHTLTFDQKRRLKEEIVEVEEIPWEIIEEIVGERWDELVPGN